LQLLDDRTREVDTLVRDAREQAREITYDAEKRAQEITAEAEQQRAELAEQVAALRTEVAEVRAELAQLRAAQPGAPPAPIAAAVVSPEPETPGAPFGPTLRDPVAAADAADAAETADAAGTPRWGRPSSISAAQQAIRARSSRPRWLPRWLPFVILLLGGAGAVMASVNVQSSGRGSTGDQPGPGVIVVTLAPNHRRFCEPDDPDRDAWSIDNAHHQSGRADGDHPGHAHTWAGPDGGLDALARAECLAAGTPRHTECGAAVLGVGWRTG